jgi:hypothetical protein
MNYACAMKINTGNLDLFGAFLNDSLLQPLFLLGGHFRDVFLSLFVLIMTCSQKKIFYRAKIYKSETKNKGFFLFAVK